MYRASKRTTVIQNDSRRRLSANLIKYRREHNMAREELALLCEIDTKYLSKMEKGNARVSIDELDKLSAAMGVSVRDLMSEQR